MPQSGVQPGQQAIPNPSRAMPVTRAMERETSVSSTPNNNRTTSDGITINARPVAASATAAIPSTFFIEELRVHSNSKGGDALNHPESCDAANAVRRYAPCPGWLWQGRASDDESAQRHDSQDRRDEEELADLNANVEEEQRDWNCCLGQTNRVQRACETEPV